VMLTTHPHLVLRLRMRSYTSSPPGRLHGVQRDSFTFFHSIPSFLNVTTRLQCFYTGWKQSNQ
jgi:hypothetical protein